MNTAEVEPESIVQQLEQPLQQLLDREQIREPLTRFLRPLYIPLAAWIRERQQLLGSCYLLGINGAQGSGKSTLSAILQLVLEQEFNCRVASLSIDDLYHTRARRKQLAQEVHPLFINRGVPGTHDIELGLSLLQQLKSANEAVVPIPRFDKGCDDRRPRSEWIEVTTPLDIIIFEGWCVGAPSQSASELLKPLNTLEQREDRDGVWRQQVNSSLEGSYRQLFALLDGLIMLKVPSFSHVRRWRALQEEKLRTNGGEGMTPDLLDHFIAHFERLTCHMLETLPQIADITLEVGDDHQIGALKLDQEPERLIGGKFQ